MDLEPGEVLKSRKERTLSKKATLNRINIKFLKKHWPRSPDQQDKGGTRKAEAQGPSCFSRSGWLPQTLCSHLCLSSMISWPYQLCRVEK